MTDVTDEIDRFSAVLQAYGDGRTSPLMCLADLHDLVMKPFLDGLEKGEKRIRFGSCCCRKGHPPDRTMLVRITIQPHGYEAERIDVPVTPT